MEDGPFEGDLESFFGLLDAANVVPCRFLYHSLCERSAEEGGSDGGEGAVEVVTVEGAVVLFLSEEVGFGDEGGEVGGDETDGEAGDVGGKIDVVKEAGENVAPFGFRGGGDGEFVVESTGSS